MKNISEITPYFQKSDVAFVGLFGSRANDSATSESDYDFLIEFKKDKKYTLLDISRLKRSLEKTLGSPVDLVTTNSLHPYIRKNVLSSTQVIYDNRS